jgi:hypothetical protein
MIHGILIGFAPDPDDTLIIVLAWKFVSDPKRNCRTNRGFKDEVSQIIEVA